MKLYTVVALATSLIATGATAQSFRPLPTVTTPLPLGDDNTMAVTLPFAIKVGAEASYTNGLITQNATLLKADNTDTIVPFFDDLEARSETGQANYGTSTLGGRPAFIATYANVGLCCGVDGRRSSVQFVLIDRSDLAAGDFDVEVNTQGLNRASNAGGQFIIDNANAGRAGVAQFPAGAAAYRSTWTFRNGALTSGTGPTLITAAAAVPTMSEWAMILFGTVLAGGAALYLQRRRTGLAS
ncbi:IPTL-CTERM sorting domain-containing protein [Brevundimonas sp. NIBR11]|uniref:IPTL-CTERM sorting domain-containing protein n=1 Tax=Brevundimonas sp. NIBR11 TaxID=3015999 RepID=UPI0022EFF7F3|nr:IPTL-CTERM sorting domain-containing protein [Brevundimonas sp. NIBR11]WGM31514.1 hypothetical protein KKHFBJBL_01761 [Brevundimonas sp. NIBR11]